MTFAVGIGTRYVGLVAADTRVGVPPDIVGDEGVLRFKNPLGGDTIILPAEHALFATLYLTEFDDVR